MGLEIASRVRKGSFTTHPVCEVAYACMLFNLGMIREMSGDQTKARELFTQSLDQSRLWVFLRALKMQRKLFMN
ncbi:hypothetical protein DFP72DRAFT_870914 [Ephemerocybe angulata]|uniref:Uncharacterized protein n=1 Tax=Ephemerocybe angulata TaxID=980116 RepID=A0A8H6IEL4_9AGAR|nr:hypothetical protein DFP72DRAFT_870914 [Tulosesus angulatus]